MKSVLRMGAMLVALCAMLLFCGCNKCKTICRKSADCLKVDKQAKKAMLKTCLSSCYNDKSAAEKRMEIACKKGKVSSN